MLIILLLISSLNSGCLGSSRLGSHSDQVVYITPEMGFIEGEYDISPLWDAMVGLQALSKEIKAHCYLLEVAAEEYQFESTKVSKWILQHVDSALMHTEDRLKSLGFLKNSKSKRSPFAFIGSIQSALFGTVTEEQFEDFKSHISSNFKLIHSDNRELRGLVSENREALRKTLNVLNTIEGQIIKELNDNSKLFTRFFQLGFALDAIERVVIILNAIKSSADHNYLSRYIFTPTILRNHILQLSDGLYGQSPVFNTRTLEYYYKIPISLSTVTGKSIRQIVSIPMISSSSKFHLSHRPTCPTSHVCVENHEGLVTIPISDYLTCEAVTSKSIPTICRMRACVTSDRTVCRMANITSAVVSSEISFSAKIDCDDGHSSEVVIRNITLVSLPIHCSLHSTHLNIRKIDSMKNSTSSHQIIYIPFSVDNGELTINKTSLRQAAPGLQSKSLHQLLLTKVPKSHLLSEPFPYNDTYHHISLSSLSISSVGFFATIVLFFLLYVCRNRIYKNINPN